MKFSTKNKIRIATFLYRAIHTFRSMFGKGDHVTCKRDGLLWSLDLSEGIDFSIYLIGGFEPATLRLYKSLLGKKDGEIVFDIGANIGSHTLPLTKIVSPNSGKVYSFEPTVYAYNKLIANLSLNPELASHVVPVQAMLVSHDGVALDQEIYSSWPLASQEHLHEEHGGKLRSTEGAKVFSLDSFIKQQRIDRLDFIKLDVDGHETSVLEGSWESIDKFHPSILMEWAANVSPEEQNALRGSLLRLLDMGYVLFNGSTGKSIDGGVEMLDMLTPSGGSMNILLNYVPD